MTPPPSIVGNVAASRWLGHPWRRRIIALVLLILFALLSLFPRQYRAASSLTPTDPAALGLSGALGQFGAFSNVFGNQAAIEVSLKVARSKLVRDAVVKRMDLVNRRHLGDTMTANRWLEDHVEIRSLRGGIIQLETKLDEPRFALELVSAMSAATRDRLAEISRAQTEYKREVLVDLVRTAGVRLDRAQSNYDNFRRRTRYSSPGPSINLIGQRIPAIQTQIKAKEIELNTARTFATDDNMQVRQIVSEIEALRRQLVEAQSLDAGDPNSVNRVVVQSTQVVNLERELGIALSLYWSYRRFLEQTSVEDLTSTGNVRILEPPYIDPARQFRTVPAALFILVLIIAVAVEFYLLRPPVGSDLRYLRPER